MNLIEKKVHALLRNNPHLKTFVRNLYQSFFDLMPVKSVISDYPIVSVDGYFYGFHDHSPFSFDNTKILVHKAPSTSFMPFIGDEIEFGYLTGAGFKNFISVGCTKTWNWHMGSKLQWIGDSNCIALNDFRNGPIIRLIDLDTNNQREVSGFISSVSPNGEFFVEYDFIRVERLMPGYGYKLAKISDDLSKEECRLSVRCLKSGKHLNTLELRDVIAFKPTSDMKGAYHFFTHAVVSPDSKKVSFFHRWLLDSKNPAKRRTRLMVLDIETGAFSVMPTNGLVSHYCWFGDNRLVAFCSTEDKGTGYHIFSIAGDMRVNEFHFLNELNEDGHPMIHAARGLMVTDTYPNRRRMKSLYLHNLNKNILTKLGQFYMPKEFQSPDAFHHWCCDLHPRWDRAGKTICFDTVYSGVRSLSIMNVSELLD